jgi:branched-chain amino acid transport system substrate-binding protein
MFNYENIDNARLMSHALPLKALIILLLAAAGGSLGGVGYYYQARATSLNNQVSSLNNNASSLNEQIATLKSEISNLTSQISQLQRINSQLNQSSVQIQSLEAQLANADAHLQSLETQLADEISKVQALEASFNTQLGSLNAQLAQEQAEIAQLQSLVSQLQAQLAGSLCVSGRTITIGELLDLSSALSTQGLRADRGSVIAINDINSFLSRAGCTLKFATSVHDYALNNSLALTDLQSLTASGVQVVVGPLNSGAAQFLLSFADSNHIVLISPSSTSGALAIPNDYLFRIMPPDGMQGLADARMMIDRGASAVIIIERHDTYGDSVANATAMRFKALGGHVIDVIPYDTAITDFTPILTTLNNDFQSANSTYPNKVAMDFVSFEEFGQIINQANLQHPGLLKDRLPWFGTDGEAQDSILTNNPVTGPLIAQVRLPSTLFAFQNNTKTERLYAAFAVAYPGDVCDLFCTATYDDVWLAALATIQAGAYNGTRIQAMLPTVTSNYYGVTGWLELDQNGDRVASLYQVWKVAFQGSNSIPSWIFAGTWDSTSDMITWISPP